MKSISEMQRQSATNMPEKAGSIADAFCRAVLCRGRG